MSKIPNNPGKFRSNESSIQKEIPAKPVKVFEVSLYHDQRFLSKEEHEAMLAALNSVSPGSGRLRVSSDAIYSYSDLAGTKIEFAVKPEQEMVPNPDYDRLMREEKNRKFEHERAVREWEEYEADRQGFKLKLLDAEIAEAELQVRQAANVVKEKQRVKAKLEKAIAEGRVPKKVILTE